ncbi:hypothetical protein [Planomonospora parontospora]|uniref:hypothetical protein n=1 Tax=Planomonospora parontospora TaxID=58119 RepID=UPI001784111C|nr:hypothetical protein [Planomonospora parontospora]
MIAAEDLREALEREGITADVHDGYGLALVSVWVGLIVWCDGERFWWRTGWDDRRQRFTYAWHPAADPVRAARRVAFRYTALRTNSRPALADPAAVVGDGAH